MGNEDSTIRVLAVIMSLLFVASLVAILSKKIKFPYTIFLVAIGLLLGWAAQVFPLLHHLKLLKLTPEVVLFVFLPVLLFESAFNLDVRALLKNLVPIMVLAIPALLISTGIVGAILFFFTGLPLEVCLLFGALISATDPVAVISLFKEIGAPKRLNLLVEGESLFNDGTALVTFHIILGVILSGSFSLYTIGHGVIEFVVVFLGGAGVGVLFGYLFSKLIEFVENDRLVEITLTTILAHTTFLVAEHFFHVSGVIATVAAGLTLGSFGRNKISPLVYQHLESFWEYFAFICNSLIFLLVGLSIDLNIFWGNYQAVLLAAVAILIGRAIAVYSLFPLMDRLHMVEKVSRKFQTVIFWGGLRGALAMAMALSIPDFLEFKPFLLALTLGVVLFTLFVNGLTIRPLISFLGLEKYSLKERFERAQAALVVKKKALETMTSFAEKEMIHGRVVQSMREAYGKELGHVAKELDEFKKEEKYFGLKEEYEVVWTHALLIEKAQYHKLFAGKFLREDNLREMYHTIDIQMDRIKEGRSMQGIENKPPIFSQIEGSVFYAIGKNVFFKPLIRRYKTNRIAASFERKRARLIVARMVLQELVHMEKRKTYSAKPIRKVKEFYRHILKTTTKRMEDAKREFPEYVEKVEVGLLKRFCLNQELQTYRTLYSQGSITGKVFHEMEDSIEKTLRKMRARPVKELMVAPSKLVRMVPLFQDMEEKTYGQLVLALNALSFFPGDDIVLEGEIRDSLFVIGRGRVDVLTRDETGKEVAIRTLHTGDFFGEGALLYSKPRTATIRASTPCTLLELTREKLQIFLRRDPRLKEVLEGAYRIRILSNLIAHVPFFQHIPAEKLEEIVALLEVENFTKGYSFLMEGPRAQKLYMVKNGEVELHQEGERVKILKTGDFFGEEVLRNLPASWLKVNCSTDVEMYSIGVGKVELVLKKKPGNRET